MGIFTAGMKLIRSIAIIGIAALILGETLGMQLVRELCMPCQSETTAIAIPFDEVELACSCHHDMTHETTACCEMERHDAGDEDQADANCHSCFKDHENPGQKECTQHHKEVHFLSKNADFVQQVQGLEDQLVPAVLVLLNAHTVLHNTGRAVSAIRFKEEKQPPDRDLQASLCTYLI